MSTKELQNKIVDNMRRWQKIENATVSATSKIIAKTDNDVVRLVMEIIQHDSMVHHRTQKMISASLTHETISLNPDELEKVWTMIEDHIKLEKETISLAQEALESLKGKKMVVQEYLLRYLEMDEMKHDKLLESLETIKKGMYPGG
jgi:hypothetical protein